MAQMITAAKLDSINTAVSTAFNEQFEVAESIYEAFTYVAGSESAEEFYPRLDQLPGLREWIGDRIFNELSYSGFSIKNKTFEGTITAKREDIEDDKYSILKPAAGQLGQKAKNLPDLLIARLLKAGHTTPTYDGQNFFDTAHPDWDSTGATTTSANYFPAPAGQTAVSPWYLFDTRQILKALIFQKRRPFNLVPLFDLTSEDVFKKNQFVWGVDGRCNAGFGIWQTAIMSTAPINAANYESIRASMTSHHTPAGEPLGIRPTLWVGPSTLIGAANRLFKGQYADASVNGGVVMSNEWEGDCKVLENPWLS